MVNGFDQDLCTTASHYILRISNPLSQPLVAGLISDKGRIISCDRNSQSSCSSRRLRLPQIDFGLAVVEPPAADAGLRRVATKTLCFGLDTGGASLLLQVTTCVSVTASSRGAGESAAWPANSCKTWLNFRVRFRITR